MKKIIISIILIMFATSIFTLANDKPAFKIYNSGGIEISYSDLIYELVQSEVIFFGELHNNPIAHWLQYEVTESCFTKRGGRVILGAEMFESDNQLLMNEYLNGLITEKSFKKEMRLWNNYSTDYRPLVEFAKDNGIPFIATNVPRRYASVVSKKGFEGLKDISSTAKKFIAPLPINYDPEVACYKKMTQMKGMPSMGGGKMKMKMQNFPKAQAIKDATMNYFITEAMVSGSLFIHYNGSYHSDNYEGIVWHLLKSKPSTRIKTITTVMQKDINSINEETKKSADFIIVVNANMTGSY